MAFSYKSIKIVNIMQYFICMLAVGTVISYSALSNINYSYGQSSTMPTMDNSSMTQQHAQHTFDNLIISEDIPLRGQLDNGDYILLMDLTPFATSVEGHSHVAVKIPCTDNGTPKASILTGILPNLNSLDLGKAINNGTLNGNYLDLSAQGKSCLYHAELPSGTTDIVLTNISNKTLSFDKGGHYSVTITVHGTAIQHLGANQTGMQSPG